MLWYYSGAILSKFITEAETAQLAGLYLRILILGTPGFAAFECWKRFMQAQGLFHAPTIVLVVAAPLNAFLGWLLVWHFRLGGCGSPGCGCLYAESTAYSADMLRVFH